MIKEVDNIPKLVRELKPSRASSVRDDVREALDNHISKFEFVGEIYTPNRGQYAGYLGRQAVLEATRPVLRGYVNREINAHLNINEKMIAKIVWDVDDMFDVYCYREKDGRERVFMEIHYGRINSIIDKARRGG